MSGTTFEVNDQGGLRKISGLGSVATALGNAIVNYTITSPQEPTISATNPTPKVGDQVVVTVAGEVTWVEEFGMRFEVEDTAGVKQILHRRRQARTSTIDTHIKRPPLPTKGGTILQDADGEEYVRLGEAPRLTYWYNTKTGNHVNDTRIAEMWATGQLTVKYPN